MNAEVVKKLASIAEAVWCQRRQLSQNADNMVFEEGLLPLAAESEQLPGTWWPAFEAGLASSLTNTSILVLKCHQSPWNYCSLPWQWSQLPPKKKVSGVIVCYDCCYLSGIKKHFQMLSFCTWWCLLAKFLLVSIKVEKQYIQHKFLDWNNS